MAQTWWIMIVLAILAIAAIAARNYDFTDRNALSCTSPKNPIPWSSLRELTALPCFLHAMG